MRQAARVSSIDALKEFRIAFDHFAKVTAAALGEAIADVRRTTSWIEHERRSHWEGRKRAWTARLAEARNELFRAQVAGQDGLVPATLERRRVEQAQEAVDEAEAKLAAIKRWGRQLERETILFRGECQSLARTVEGDVPQGLARLDKMLESLERYVRLAAPHASKEDGET